MGSHVIRIRILSSFVVVENISLPCRIRYKRSEFISRTSGLYLLYNGPDSAGVQPFLHTSTLAQTNQKNRNKTKNCHIVAFLFSFFPLFIHRFDFLLFVCALKHCCAMLFLFILGQQSTTHERCYQAVIAQNLLYIIFYVRIIKWPVFVCHTSS